MFWRHTRGSISAEEAEKQLRMDYVESIGNDVVFDMSRELRKCIPEVVYAASKDPATVANIAKARSGLLIVSKASPECFSAVCAVRKDAEYREKARIIVVGRMPEQTDGPIGIISAGTSDIPVAEEAKAMAEAMGVSCLTFYDVGVAGMHRILNPMREIIDKKAKAVIVVAGMEGALATIVSSLSPVPVIGVPTSVGYGIGGQGKAALYGMLQSCSPGLSVVNIDNGIGAGATAGLIAKGHQ